MIQWTESLSPNGRVLGGGSWYLELGGSSGTRTFTSGSLGAVISSDSALRVCWILAQKSLEILIVTARSHHSRH